MRKLLPLLSLAALAVPAPALAAHHRADGSSPAGRELTRAVTTVKTRTFNAVGAGSVVNAYLHLVPHGRAAHRPLVLAEDAAWCPDCQANSWPLAVALSRFGSFTKLGRNDSGTYFRPTDGFPAYHHTKGISFWSATYASRWIRFTEVTWASKTGKRLDRPTRAESHVIKRFSPHQDFPSVSLGGLYGQLGAHIPIVQQLQGQSWRQIEAALRHPRSPLGQTIIGQANVDAAAICKATKNKPRSVCRSKGVRAAAKFLPTS